MAKVYIFYVGVLAGLALCKYSQAEWNATEGTTNRTEPQCPHQSNGDNCTDTGQWHGHFSKCPEELTYYCIHGECRYIKDQETPSCRCQHGYIGSRCEYADLDLRIGEKRQIIIICVVVGLVLLIILLLFICIFSHRRGGFCKQKRRRRDEPRNGTEKLPMMDVNATLTGDPSEQPCV